MPQARFRLLHGSPRARGAAGGLVGGRAPHMRSPAGVRAAGGGTPAVGGKKLEDATGGSESRVRVGPPGLEPSQDRGGSPFGASTGPRGRREGRLFSASRIAVN